MFCFMVFGIFKSIIFFLVLIAELSLPPGIPINPPLPSLGLSRAASSSPPRTAPPLSPSPLTPRPRPRRPPPAPPNRRRPTTAGGSAWRPARPPPPLLPPCHACHADVCDLWWRCHADVCDPWAGLSPRPMMQSAPTPAAFGSTHMPAGSAHGGRVGCPRWAWGWASRCCCCCWPASPTQCTTGGVRRSRPPPRTTRPLPPSPSVV